MKVLGSHQKVILVTAFHAIRRENRWQKRGKAMPILMMALLALAVFGVIGILLTVAVVLEQSKLKRAAKDNAAHPLTSGAIPSLNPRLR
jgi:hypothetical protein